MSQSSFEPRKEKCGKKNKDTKKKTFAQELLSTFIYIVVITAIFVGIRTFLFAPVSVEGDSMNPTLTHEDRLLLNRIASIERYDVVVFPSPADPSTQFIKRVIGVEGDQIEYRNQVLYINGEEINESYIDSSDEAREAAEIYNSDFTLASLQGVEKVPEDSYFVMGDNRGNSKDSRSFGFIDSETVTGRTRLRIWPFSRFGMID